MKNLSTSTKPTWCPGCYNFQILAGVKNAIEKSRIKKEDFAIVTGIGCHAKLFDYINLNGINTLHGRVLPTCLGIKIGNPNLNVLGFAGDGDAYAEGMAHLIHSARYNSDIKYFVHNNQVFALTVGQPTPTTEIGFKDKTTPEGVKTYPINPIKIMLACGASFVARVFSDVKQIEYILEEALKHKGFAFIEVIQPCLIFHPETYMKKFYSLDKAGHDKTSFEQAWKKAQEFDYNGVAPLGVPQGGARTSSPSRSERRPQSTEYGGNKIPLGIFYQAQKPVFEEQYPQLLELKKNKTSWKDIRR